MSDVMRRIAIVLALAIALSPILLFAADAAPTENDPVASARAVALSEKLRCLVCQNQTIADSNAELAQDLRRQIREQIAAGKSDKEIVDYMVARYGDFVLYRPPFKERTWLLWLGPFALLLMVAAFAAFFIRRSRAPAAAPADPAALKKLLDDEKAGP